MTSNMFDNNLYDRQIRTYGEDAVKKITSSSVLIMGLVGGLGTEVGKNLALGGIKNIHLFDSNKITKQDLETGFYYTKNDIGFKHSEILANKLAELNPYVSIHIENSYELNQDVTILINQPVHVVENVSQWSRAQSKKLVVLYSGGFSGVIFVDAGLSHIVTDITSENMEPVQIANITQDGKVICAPNTSHNYQTGDFVEFTNLEGTNLNQFNNIEYKIKVDNPTTFTLDNFTYNNDYVFINGTVNYIKKPVEIYHETWDNQINKPTLSFSFDMELSEKIVNTYIDFYSGRDIFSLPTFAKLFNWEFMPVVSLMGSITSSEVIKLITNKYMPVSQWFTWSDETLIPKQLPFYKDFLSAKTIYGRLYGLEVEKKLLGSKWLIVGSGAIGCEHLKNLAFMGIKDIILTDPDTIEKSNLNRQFLFRSHHIGQPKSETAAYAIKNMKSNINITSYLEKVGPDNLSFTNNIMKNVTGVLNALDNIKARRFMDEQCFKFNLPLFESGTTGTKGNTQAVIPFITETYSASSDPEQEKTFPMCTIKSFPNEISHTIHWAMDQFEFFNRAPITLNKWIQNPDYINQLSQVEKNIAMEDIELFTFTYPTQINELLGCAEWAVDMFNNNYCESIKKLLHTFSPTHEVSPGVLFWSAGKRCPQPIDFDINNELHLDYIEATTHLLARISGVDDNFTRQDLYNNIKDYKPTIKQELESDKEKEFKFGIPSNFTDKYISQEFEKDDETNWHVKWVCSASNLRAKNYSIPQANYQQTKGIAGRIIPAIATTTSAVSGLIILEMLKYLCGHDKIDTYRSTFINLSEPMLVYSEPLKAQEIDIAGVKINSWTKFDYKNDTTLGEFKSYYEEMFKTTISMIVIGTIMVYAEFLGSESLDKKLSYVIKEHADNQDLSIPVIFNLCSENELIDIPAINVCLE